MNPMFLQFEKRQAELVEWMDRSDCDLEKLTNTYHYFSYVNRFVTRWHTVYSHYIRPYLHPGKTYRLLDVGSGGGDIAQMFFNQAKKDGFKLDVTGIDPDRRALQFAKQHTVNHDGNSTTPENGAQLRFIQADTSHYVRNGEKYDFVICNHVLHHLDTESVHPFLSELEQLASICVVCSDIERSKLGYALFSVLTMPFFNNSFIRADGLLSIKKSFRQAELRNFVPEGWSVHRKHPFRLLAVHKAHSTS